MSATVYQYFFGSLGVACALIFNSLGAAYGTAKSGVGLCSMGVMRPDLLMRGILAPIMAGILGIYGLILAIVLLNQIDLPPKEYPPYKGFLHFAAGLASGLAGFASGVAIGIVGDAGVRAYAQQNRLFTSLILVLIFAEALAIFGLIIGLVMATKS